MNLSFHYPANSIDDIDGNYDFGLAPRRDEDGKPTITIPPEDEFWGHCSNLQVWAEHNYDTQLLHRELAFPLLKQLMKIGDPLAKKVYKEEVQKRFLSHNPFVMEYLLKELNLKVFNKEELVKIFRELDVDSLKKLAEKDSYYYTKIYSIILTIANNMREYKFVGGTKLLINTLIEITNDKRHFIMGVYIIENYIRRKALTKEEQKKILNKINFEELLQYYTNPAMLDHIKELKKLKDSLN